MTRWRPLVALLHAKSFLLDIFQEESFQWPFSRRLAGEKNKREPVNLDFIFRPAFYCENAKVK